jgi:hypothetical protein
VVVSQALTLKILNLCLAKYHFASRGASLPSHLAGRNPGLLPEHRRKSISAPLRPSALYINLRNYGEPLVSPG